MSINCSPRAHAAGGGAQVVLFFRPARLLVTSDLFWNYPSGAPGGTKLWKFGMDQASVLEKIQILGRCLDA